MRSTTVCRAWVVYRMTLPKNAVGGNVVCEQREWEAVEAARPGYHTLLHVGIGTEQEAEKLARGATVESVPQAVRKKGEMAPLFATGSSSARVSARPRSPRTGLRAV
jgi:hypothetical protein